MKVAKDSSAPGALELLRVFINTADLQNPERDELSNTQAATAWLQSHGLLGEADWLDPEEYEMVLEVREAFRRELLSHTREADPQEAWDALAYYADRAELGVRCAENPAQIALVAEGRGAQVVIGRLFATMYDAIRTGHWPRLKACRKESCLFAFYDRSKNASGAWCDMAICGNRVKAQRRRKREAG